MNLAIVTLFQVTEPLSLGKSAGKSTKASLDPRTVSLFGAVTNGKASELRDFGCRSFQQNQFGIEFTYAL
jgi:hypothetical protein